MPGHPPVPTPACKVHVAGALNGGRHEGSPLKGRLSVGSFREPSGQRTRSTGFGLPGRSEHEIAHFVARISPLNFTAEPDKSDPNELGRKVTIRLVLRHSCPPIERRRQVRLVATSAHDQGTRSSQHCPGRRTSFGGVEPHGVFRRITAQKCHRVACQASDGCPRPLPLWGMAVGAIDRCRLLCRGAVATR